MSTAQNDFYIYLYLDQDNTPFYVGKGHRKRYLIFKHLNAWSTNSFLERKILKIGIENVIIKFFNHNKWITNFKEKEHLIEEEAFCLEEYYIAGYGRRDLGKGTLCNLTDGGEGLSGHKHTEETRLQMSEAARKRLPISEVTRNKMRELNLGKKHHLGKPRSEESKKKQSESRKGCSGSFLGKHHTEESNRKNSEAHKGQIAWNKGKKGIFKGRKMSHSFGEKIKESWIKRREKYGPSGGNTGRSCANPLQEDKNG